LHAELKSSFGCCGNKPVIGCQSGFATAGSDKTWDGVAARAHARLYRA